ncbi:MAG: 1-(5-phosphoribosyl)-5-amino-4-imidazole-carboxyl ate carboxylase [Planctomycetota bacterium]|nr:MAG: 1-(5-phosphoribosyl)-5-amino-4-imidazole-carboxyl ate carboxylase [Planctomycetota bacterium]
MSPEEGLRRLRDLPTEDLGFAQLDHHRVLRNGQPEVVYGEGKTPAQIVEIVARLQPQRHPVLVTRFDAAAHAACADQLATLHAIPGDYDDLARTWLWCPAPPPITGAGTVAVVSAGTSDLPVAQEAAVTLTAFGNTVERITDVGVAGLHRMLARLPVLREARVIVAVAGMEGALPSVLAGLVAAPVVAVPTSVGYGASLGGIAALLAMLNSCAAGVTVVNIDNGFGAACVASRINHPVIGTPAVPASPAPSASHEESDA